MLKLLGPSDLIAQSYLFSKYAEADSLACHMKAVLGKLTTQTDVLGTQLISRWAFLAWTLELPASTAQEDFWTLTQSWYKFCCFKNLQVSILNSTIPHMCVLNFYATANVLQTSRGTH